MGPNKGWQPMPSQRDLEAIRDLEAKNTELSTRINTLEHELSSAMANHKWAERRTKEVETELAKLNPTLDNRAAQINDVKDQSDAFYHHVDFLYDNLKRYETKTISLLVAAATKKIECERPESNLRYDLLMTSDMKPARDILLQKHEEKIADHLKEEVYTADHFSLLRLVGRLSKRVCGLIEQSIKYAHKSDGKKERQMLAPGSRVPAPSLFALKDINAAEAASEARSKLALNDHEDRKGADICGKQYALDRAIFDSLSQTTRSLGMASQGTEKDPHMICVTGDGAGLSARDSGVRAGHFCGSTNMLAQSSSIFVNWLFYKEACKAEDYTILAGRLRNILPDMRRLYKNGNLSLDGKETGIYIKFVLVADKPFIRHVCGM